MPDANITFMLIYISGIIMLLASAFLAAGWHQKIAAMILLLILFPITILVQLDNLKDLGPFFKNIAKAGSLLLIINYNKHENKKSGVVPSYASN